MNNIKQDRARPRKVVFYGRVSTEHEAQISALDNQMEWYQELASSHPNWTVVDQYVDEGITGTQAKKRPSFLRMIEDAKSGKFDLIVTREVCHFARNTVDTLSYTRELAKLGVEVYFAADGIWTMDNDGELRLSLMATLAQEESRKISERVLAGQRMSREKKVLYGNGNILGYDLDKANNTYVINEEQAETVRMIFEQYATGDGLTKVAKTLMEKGRKDGAGHVNWDASKVTRVLRKATYMGYCVYNRSRTVDYLEHRRVNNTDEDTYVMVKGDFPAIIDEELWYKCNAIRKGRTRHLLDENGKPRRYGGTIAKNVWVTKLVCSCGAKFRRCLWQTKADGTQTWGFECYRHTKRSLQFLQQHGLPDAERLLPAGDRRSDKAERAGQTDRRTERKAEQPDSDEGVQPDHPEAVSGTEQRDQRPAEPGHPGTGGAVGPRKPGRRAGHRRHRGFPVRSGDLYRRQGERVVHPDLCEKGGSHGRHPVCLGTGSGPAAPDGFLRSHRAKGIPPHLAGKQFIPGRMARHTRRTSRPALPFGSGGKPEWGHISGRIGTGQAAIKNPRK